MRRLVSGIRKKDIIKAAPRVSLGTIPMLISLELGFSLLAGYFAARFFLSGESLRKALGIALFLILLDEFMREGYFFNPSDLLVMRLTHEKVFIGVFLMGMLPQGYHYVKKQLVS